MADDKVRMSQVIGVFGPGAMLDLPERSVLVQGLDHWEMFGTGTFKVIEEPRLARDGFEFAAQSQNLPRLFGRHQSESRPI